MASSFDVGLFIPSLNRPHNLAKVLPRAKRTGAAVYCVVDEDDIESQRVCADLEVRYWTDRAGWFCQRIQFLFDNTDEEWFFTGSDDVVYPADMFDGMFQAADPSWKVISPNDGHNANGTNYLIERSYVQEHGGHYGTPGLVYHQGYRHNWSDDELAEVAASRGVFGRTMGVLVESQHPVWGNAPDDATYQRARAKWADDEALFRRRCHLWR